MVYLSLAAGLALLFVGGEFLVRGAVSVARRLGVSELVIGLTLVGFGTSAPELVASVEAALLGAPGIAVGNVVGSNIANVLLILGLGALLTPMRTTRRAFLRDGPVLLAASGLLAAACLLDVIGRPIAAVFLALLLAYTWHTYRSERAGAASGSGVRASEAEVAASRPGSLGLGLAISLGGLVGVLLGATLLVEAAITIARLWGVSEAVIGLTVVAVGTSLPELATTLVAAWRRQPDVAFGNVIGSNLFNIFGILGLTALVQPLPVPPEIARFDVWVMLGVALFLVAFAVTGWRVSRAEGTAFLLGYAAYLLVVPG